MTPAASEKRLQRLYEKYPPNSARRPEIKDIDGEKQKKYSLKKWPNSMTAAPANLLRSAVFGVAVQNRHAEKTLIIKNNYAEIEFNGWTLNQNDLDVWLSVIQQCQLQEGWEVSFKLGDLLKSLNKTMTWKNKEWLKDCLNRLVKSNLKIKSNQNFYNGNLLSSVKEEGEGKRLIVKFDKEIISFFETSAISYIESEVRLRLRGHQLALWLHSFFSTHQNPFPIKIRTIKQLCGSQCHDELKFRQILKRALKLLDAEDQKTNYLVDGELIKVVKVVKILAVPMSRKPVPKGRKPVPQGKRSSSTE